MSNPARTRDRTWLWIIGAIVLLLLAWGVTRLLIDQEEPLAGRAVGIPVVAPDPVVPVDPLRPGDDASGVAATSGPGEPIPVATIAVTPEPFYGRPMVGIGVVAADQSPAAGSDQGFWLEQEGRRIFAVVAAAPDRPTTAIGFLPGQRIEMSGQVYPGELASLVGADLDPGMQLMLSGQPAFLMVDPATVRVLR